MISKTESTLLQYKFDAGKLFRAWLNHEYKNLPPKEKLNALKEKIEKYDIETIKNAAKKSNPIYICLELELYEAALFLHVKMGLPLDNLANTLLNDSNLLEQRKIKVQGLVFLRLLGFASDEEDKPDSQNPNVKILTLHYYNEILFKERIEPLIESVIRLACDNQYTNLIEQMSKIKWPPKTYQHTNSKVDPRERLSSALFRQFDEEINAITDLGVDEKSEIIENTSKKNKVEILRHIKSDEELLYEALNTALDEIQTKFNDMLSQEIKNKALIYAAKNNLLDMIALMVKIGANIQKVEDDKTLLQVIQYKREIKDKTILHIVEISNSKNSKNNTFFEVKATPEALNPHRKTFIIKCIPEEVTDEGLRKLGGLVKDISPEQMNALYNEVNSSSSLRAEILKTAYAHANPQNYKKLTEQLTNSRNPEMKFN